MTSKFDLRGIEMHNLLAFLSLLGLLKTLEVAMPQWSPRVEWSDISPRLCVSDDVQEHDISAAAVDGIIKFGKKMDFRSYELKLNLDEFKDIQHSLDPDILVALGSDGALGEKDKKLIPTPLCMMLGSGHQFFLSRLSNATSIKGEYQSVEKDISATLFERWNYDDKDSKIMFRWDPKEYRPHAYRNKDPSSSDTYTMNGANRLAAVGFTSYYCMPTNHGLATTACEKNSILWPVWTPAISLASISSIMRHPDMLNLAMSNNSKKDVGKHLREYGVRCIMKADLFWEGKYKNVTVAEQIMA